MKNLLQELVTLLSLEPLENNIFRGQSQDLGYNRIYGGQVLGQALAAGQQTVQKDRQVHSCHGYFLREGDTRQPIIYNVENTRDGKSFDTRHVTAIQKGRPIFTLTASFHIEEAGFDHQDTMPDVDPPDSLKDEYQLRLAFKNSVPEHLRKKLLFRSPVEIRPVLPKNPYLPSAREPIQQFWFKTIDKLPDDPAIHKYLLAYASDFQLLPTTLFPHGVVFFQPDVQIASIDHAMWFHRPFRADQWLLYTMDSPSASHACGLARGQIFNQEGYLVASTVQEGLIRKRS
ncbi:acyl-CoA thioesterase II [Candidatus Sororendozoicomonas aggregata]|uniref:acyl-CoA thioesterase II n=1 Tax=Candidatus Sororendozoicomonas aggregata TaxID=3073239 RepID=UPI002ED59CF8